MEFILTHSHSLLCRATVAEYTISVAYYFTNGAAVRLREYPNDVLHPALALMILPVRPE